MNGLLIKGVGGLYTVWCDGERYPVKARGKFRKNSFKPVIGDKVSFFTAQGGEDFGAITEIEPRKNCLIRPAVANIDLLMTVFAASSPQPDLMLIDKLLLQARIAQIPAVVVINKCDLADCEPLAQQYRKSGYDVLCVSAHSGQGLAQLKSYLSGKVVAYAGQSAVGKSSLLNALTGLNLETGSVSKIERGRHTTRHVELIELGDDTWVADTPGFSLLEAEQMDPLTLKEFYPEMRPYEKDCRFLSCNHIGEPVCGVKDAAAQGLISQERLERYALLFDELKEKWSRRYD